LKFNIQYKDPKTNARAGEFETAHGSVQTPVFMPVGTAATVKAVHRDFLLNDINAQIILGNTYHLYLRPGNEIMQKAGGIHAFSNWQRPVLTDSGGYQVYSLSDARKMKEEGVTFQSHIDGSRHLFTPENVIDTQRIIGADLVMAFDECTPYPCDYSYAKKSLDLTHRWLGRCFEQWNKTKPHYGYEQTLLPIVQGSVYSDLRKKSAEFVAAANADANAIGGLSVGEPAEEMYRITEEVTAILPSEKPRYLMGVGTPANLLECIARGIDMFDCVMPTRNGRNGTIFTANGILNIRNKKWAEDFSPLDAELSPEYSKAYIRHLFVAGEMLGPIMASLQNLRFYAWLMGEARKNIIQGTFSLWKEEMVKKVSQKLA
jgi:queuine tRNA-ribosyltransferase